MRSGNSGAFVRDSITKNDATRAAEAAKSAMGRVVIDASGIPYVDSRGLEVLVDLGETLAQSGQTLKLCLVNETLREVLDLTDVGSALELSPVARVDVKQRQSLCFGNFGVEFV